MKLGLAISVGWLLLCDMTLAQTIHLGPDTPIPADVAAQAAAPLTDAQITQALTAQGYRAIKVSQHAKDHVDVTATKNGQSETLAVDPRTAQPLGHK